MLSIFSSFISHQTTSLCQRFLYTNDCEDVLPDGTGLGTYADDTTMYQCLSTNDSILCSAAQLQTAVNAVAQWGDTWKIRFEPSKCQALTVDHHRPPRNLPPIIFNGMSVAEESEIKLLGVIFDKQLLFSKHLQAVATKANQRLHLLYKAAPLLGSSGRATVYKAFVRPIMEYCCLEWIGAPPPALTGSNAKPSTSLATAHGCPPFSTAAQ